MSSEAEVPSSAVRKAKRRRGPRACDEYGKVSCLIVNVNADLRAAVRCGGTPQCSNCTETNSDCVYTEPRKRGPKTGYPEGYVEDLELRVKRMSEMLRKLQPDIDLDNLITGASPTSDAAPEDDEEDMVHVELSKHLAKLQLEHSPKRFFGPSSAFELLRNAMNLKDECFGTDPNKEYDKRLRYWLQLPWEVRTTNRWTPTYSFPSTDLLRSLIDIYFTQINPFYPVLHAPTFRRLVSEGLHLYDTQFGGVVLLVCALGSRYSDDLRVFSDEGDTLSAGWGFYEQVPVVRKELFYPPSVYEMQFYCLAALFIHGTGSPHATWSMVGLGLRFCTEAGVHRKNPEGYKMTADDELRKRAFWVLVFAERVFCSFIGRSSLIHEEDHDVSLPIECDDEYWEIAPNGQVEFNQPPDKPSQITFFNRLIELSNILATTLRYLYTNKKLKTWMGNSGAGERWEMKAVEELSRSLDTWLDRVPPHLHWTPPTSTSDPGKVIFLTQSAILRVLFHETQIQLHRPFIHKQSALSGRSLVVCATAARECIKVLEVQVFRTGIVFPHTLMATFLASVVLLLNIWGALRSGAVAVHEAKEWEDVQVCMRIFKTCETRWRSAGRLWDLIHELASVRDSSVLEQKSTGTSSQMYHVPTTSQQLDMYPLTETQTPRQAPHLAPEDLQNLANLHSSGYFTDLFQLTDFFTTPFYTESSRESAVAPTQMNVWEAAPVGFNLEEWGTYMTDLGIVGGRAT